MQSLSQASFFSFREQSLLLSSWVRKRKGGSAWITLNLWGRHSPTSRLVNLVFSRQTGFFECEHPFLDKPMVIYRSRWSNMPRMFDKDLTPFMRSLSPGRQNWASERKALQDELRQANIADTVYWGSWGNILKPTQNEIWGKEEEIYNEKLKTYQAVAQAPSNPDLTGKS